MRFTQFLFLFLFSAVSAGTEMLEIDVQLTADKQVRFYMCIAINKLDILKVSGDKIVKHTL